MLFVENCKNLWEFQMQFVYMRFMHTIINNVIDDKYLYKRNLTYHKLLSI